MLFICGQHACTGSEDPSVGYNFDLKQTNHYRDHSIKSPNAAETYIHKISYASLGELRWVILRWLQSGILTLAQTIILHF